jgi:acyl-CoA thioester hydrolase
MASEGLSTARSNPPGRSAFRHWARIPLRYTDLDTLGHVNNVASAAYIEEARCQLISPVVTAANQGHLEILIARVVIEYLAEVNYPGTVEIGTIVTRIGAKSFNLAHAIFVEGAAVPSTTAETACVWFDLTRRVTVVPPDAVVAGLRPFMIGA